MTIAQSDVKTVNTPEMGKIFSISVAHLLNDWYMNYIQTLLPFMVASGLSISKGAFLVSAFTITASLLQPVFGYLVDQKNQRWMVYAGTIWMAVLLSLIGLIHNYFLMFLIVAFAGLGTAAFHPQASAMITSVSGDKKGLFQAIFVTAGNIGWAFTPLIVVPFIQLYGLKSTPIFVIPGLLVAFLLWLTSPKMISIKKTDHTSIFSVFKSKWTDLSKIIAVVAFRSLAYFGLVAFLPLYLKDKNISMRTSSHLLFIMLFCGALGGLAGGYLSDKFGRKPIIVGSLVMATPLFYLFLTTENPLNYLFLAFAGAALLASFSVTIVVAQDILTKNAAMASGLMLGFSIGIGGLGISIIGLLAEHFSLEYAVNLLIILPFIAGLLGLSINKNK
ncbi:MAG: MFS transporter [Candidatus Gastranaerophilaceae bacterium]